MLSISGLVITLNEEKNLYRCLTSLAWLDEVLVIDSGSTDKTKMIVDSFSNTRFVYREFDNFASQCNYGLSLLLSEWVLSVDADYIVPVETRGEMLKRLAHDNNRFSAYAIKFFYCINGKPLRSALLPQRTCLYKREIAQYIEIGHGHRVRIIGGESLLKGRILHDDRKGLDVWFQNQLKYQKVEASMLRNSQSSSLSIQDKVRKHTCLAPITIVIICLIIKGGVFEGIEGLIYAYQRLVSECILYMYLHSSR